VSTRTPEEPPDRIGGVPPTLTQSGAARFWLAVFLTGVGAGLGAAVLTRLLVVVQAYMWPGPGTLSAAVARTSAWHHVVVLAAAGLLTGVGQLLLVRLSSGNGIDISAAIWFSAGRLPKLRTVGSAVLSIVDVAMGASLGREGAPKQVGAVLADALADRSRLSDEQRRLLVACGAGAGMAAAYGVPLGGALFALEVLRGMLALRLVLPALLASLVATVVSWIALPDAPTYTLPAFTTSPSILVWSLVVGPIAGFVSVGYVRAIAWAERHKPSGWTRVLLPTAVLATLGAASIGYPQLLGNGKDIAQTAFQGQMAPLVIVALLFLKPLATVACVGSGTPGGLFTPSLALGALVGAALGYAWSLVWPGVPPGLFALVGAAALLAATTQGPISTVVLLIEMTGHDRSFLAPAILAVVTATLVARTIEPRSIYDAKLTDAEVAERLRKRAPSAQ
jgi:H+/Cl- antiporter ClcA